MAEARRAPDAAARTRHVVHVIPDLDQGGAQQVLRALIGSDNRNRHTVVKLFAGSHLWDEDMASEGLAREDLARCADGVYGLGLPRTRAAFVLFPFTIIRFLRLIIALRPAVVVGWLYYGALVASVARLARLPVIWSLHAADFDLNTAFKSTTRAAIRICKALSGFVPNRIHYCSNAARLQHQRLGFAAAKSEVIENGVDVDRIRSSSVSPPGPAVIRILESRDHGTDVKLVCCVARFDPQKDHRTLLDAFMRLKASGRSFRLVLAGRGCDLANPIVEALIDEFGLQAEVSPIGVMSEVERLISRCDALVLSSRDGEAMPMVLIEALALGKPVIATRVGDVPEMVGEFGLIVPPQDGEAMSKALDRVLWQDVGYRHFVADAAPEYVRKNFSLDVLVGRWDGLIQTTAKPEL
jgi:glycosyltransferase involved in cell wall biosynthesis